MATFVSQPQPGDGAYLLNQSNQNTHGAIADQARWQRRRKHNMSLEKDVGGGGGGGGPDAEVRTELADTGGDTETFNDNSTGKGRAVSSSPTGRLTIPRTIVNELPLSITTLAGPPSAPAHTSSHTDQHLPSCTSNYTSQRTRDMDGSSNPPMGPKKSVPPHLARKKASGKDKVASSPAFGAANQNGSTYNADEDPLVHGSKAWGKSRGGGGGGGRSGRSGRGGGNSFAAARAEIPKVDPNRWKTDWTAKGGRQSWDSSSIDSGRASGGWGNKKSRAGQNANPPAGDWSGKLAPPPPDWDSRPGFRVDQSYKRIMDWMSEIEIALCAVPDQSVPMDGVTAADGSKYVFFLASLQPDKPSTDSTTRQMGEIVPSYWVPIVIGPQAPQVFWDELMRSAPAPDDPIDLEGAKPWWEMFVKSEDGCLNFLKDLPIPTVIGIDPEQEDAEQALKRKHDNGSSTFADNRRRYELERLQEKADKQKRIADKQRKLAAAEATSSTPTNHNRIKPGFKLVVRSARSDDMGAVKDIYNYYIENTTSAPEMDRMSKEQMVSRYRDIRLHRMPFLVAYKPGGIVKAPRKKKNQTNHPTRDDVQLPDTIVGFAFADDYSSSSGMYRFTAEFQFYTREGEYMNGVASCLMDRMLLLLDMTYQDRGGYEALGDDIDGLGTFRIIKNIIINLPFEKPERLEWMGRWLEGSLKFKEVGMLENIGTKNGKP